MKYTYVNKLIDWGEFASVGPGEILGAPSSRDLGHAVLVPENPGLRGFLDPRGPQR